MDALVSSRTIRVLSSAAGAARAVSIVPAERERTMDKWSILKNSKIVRITASAGTLVAVAALVGAGYKW